MAFQTFTTPWVKGYDLGVGIAMPSGSRMARSVEPSADGVNAAKGSIGNFQVTRITDSSSLQKSLGIDVEASYGAGAFGAGVSARMSFAQSQEINEQSLFLCVMMTIELGFQSIDDPKLTAPASAAAGDAPLFQSRYGEMFVSGMATGGLFAAVMNFHTKDSKEAQQIAASLKGSYGLFSGAASTSFKKVQEEHHTELGITIYHEGGPVDLIETEHLEDPQAMLDLAMKFAQAFRDDPSSAAVPYLVQISPIQIAEGPSLPNAIEVQHAADVMLLCARRRDALLDAISNLTYVQDHLDRYDQENGATADQIANAIAAAESDLDLVANCAASALRDRANALTPEEYAKSQSATYPAYTALVPGPRLIAEPEGTEVPDFSTCTSWEECLIVARAAQIEVKRVIGDVRPKWQVIRCDPPARTPVPIGKVVEVTVSFESFKGGVILMPIDVLPPVAQRQP